MSRRGLIPALLAFLGAAACTPETDTSIAIATDSLSAPSIESDSATPAQSEPAIEDPFLVYGMPGNTDAPTTIVTVPVTLVNSSRGTIIVDASAGAGSVVLDTVPEEDSVLVRIETHADSVQLSARSDQGLPVGFVTLPTRAGPQRAAFQR